MYKSEINKQEQEQWDTAMQIGKASMMHWKVLAEKMANGIRLVVENDNWMTGKDLETICEVLNEYQKVVDDEQKQLKG